MDPVTLDWFLPELLIYLCLFLSEADIVSLSQTCKRLQDVLNVNEVWKRFVTGEIKSLKSLKQQLDPPFHPNPNFCESRQHLQRRNHLISNWRNGNCVNKTSEIEERFRVGNYYLFDTMWYKDNFLLGIFDEDFYNRHHVFWNLDWIPEVRAIHHFYTFLDVIGDRFVVRTCCGVEVYQINLEDKVFPRLYNFLIEGDALDNYDFKKNNCNPNDRCPAWVVSSGGNYLVINKELSEPTNPVLHIWDIVNARKVGAFISPVFCNFVKVHSFIKDTLILVTTENEEKIYFKLNLNIQKFYRAIFKTNVNLNRASFFKHYCVTMNDSSSESEKSVTLRAFEFETSDKVNERCFPNVDYEFQRKIIRHDWGEGENAIVDVDGKLIILCSDSFHLVDALSLESLLVIPHKLNFVRIVGQISVFGSIFMATVEKNRSVKMWDVDGKKVVSNFSCEELNKDSIWRVQQFQRDFCLVPGNGPKTKCVFVDQERITVTHFW